MSKKRHIRYLSFIALAACLFGSFASATSFSINVGSRGHHGHGGHFGHRGHSGRGGHFSHHRIGRSHGHHRPYNRYNRRGYYGSRYRGSRPYTYRRPYFRSSGYTNNVYRPYPVYGANRFPQAYSTAYDLKVPLTPGVTAVVQNNHNPGWQLLAEGRVRDARYYFGDQARLNPTDAVPKFGYALSVAVSGDLVRAEWAMRRAFTADPASLHYVEFDESVRTEMDQLVVRYKSQMDAAGNNASDAFMLAALNFLGHDHQPAKEYIDLAIAAGDQSTSAENLKNQLAQLADNK